MDTAKIEAIVGSFPEIEAVYLFGSQATRLNKLLYSKPDFDSVMYLTNSFKEFADMSRIYKVQKEALKARFSD